MSPVCWEIGPLIWEQGWGKIRPIRICIRISEYSANSNFENDRKIRQIRIPKQKFEFESNPASKTREYSPKIRIRIMIVHDVILVTKTPPRKTQFSRR
jgi:hypothetical protein